MTTPRQLSSSTLIIVILLSLISAASYSLWLRHVKNREPSPATQALSAEVASESAAASSPAHVLAFSRPWLRSTNGASLFVFTDPEWSALTNAYPEKLSEVATPPTLIFSEGPVVRVTENAFESLAAELPESALQTNLVWFYK